MHPSRFMAPLKPPCGSLQRWHWYQDTPGGGFGRFLWTPMAARDDSSKAEDAIQFLESLEDDPSDQDLGFTSGDFEQVIIDNDDWGQKAYDCAMEVLEKDDTLALYSFRASSARTCVDIRIDKLTDPYGSPSLDEIGAFSRDFNERLESLLGEEAVGDIEIEISSPGATRAVKLPHELSRFSSLPMVVCSKDSPEPRIFNFIDMIDGSISVWKYADVKANRSLGKGRGLSKKQKEMRIEIPLESLLSVNVHIDV